MSILILSFIVVLCAALIIWAIDRAPVINQNLKWVLDVLVILIAVLVIAQKAGLA